MKHVNRRNDAEQENSTTSYEIEELLLTWETGLVFMSCAMPARVVVNVIQNNGEKRIEGAR